MKKKKKIYNEQTRRDWDYAYRSLLEYSNKKIHGTTNIKVHNR